MSGVPELGLTAGALVRRGFTDGARAREELSRLGANAGPLVSILARAADPDAALAGLLRLAESLDSTSGSGSGLAMLTAVADDEGTAMRLCSVLGASAALANHLARHPDHWRELGDPTLGTTRPAAYAVRAALLAAVGANPEDEAPVATMPDADALDGLRVEYRRLLLRLASRDLAHGLGIDDAAAEISDLAAGTIEAALAVARARVGESAALARLAVIAMGKCGGHELNYVSDVDVVFVFESAVDASGESADEAAALRAATQLASNLMQVC